MKRVMLMLVCAAGMLVAGDLTLTVKVEGLKTAKGVVRAALHNSADAFPMKEDKAVKKVEAKIENGGATVVFTGLDAGTYAVALYQDENSNGKLDANFLGIPKEPAGVSNNPKARMGPPRFGDAKFELKASETIVVKMN